MHYHRNSTFDAFYLSRKLSSCFPTQHVIRKYQAYARLIPEHTQGVLGRAGLNDEKATPFKNRPLMSPLAPYHLPHGE